MRKVAERVRTHRGRIVGRGLRRVELAVPASDAPLLRQVAALLRAGGEAASRLRERLAPVTGDASASSGEELVAFFRASPLVGEGLAFERDGSAGRPVDL